MLLFQVTPTPSTTSSPAPSPSPTSDVGNVTTDGSGFFINLDKLQVDGPADQVTALEVVMLAAAIVIATLLAVVIWRAAQKPRLRLVFDPVRDRWTTTTRDVVQYALSIPLLMLLWYYYFLVILLIAPNRLSMFKLILAPAAVILAVRCLAHIWHEAAHNLAKTVPLVIVTTVLMTLTVKSPQEWLAFQGNGRMAELSGPAAVTLVLADYLFTTLWFFLGARRGAVRGRKVPGIPWKSYPQAAHLKSEGRQSWRWPWRATSAPAGEQPISASR